MIDLSEHETRVALIRMRFPRLAEIADREAARKAESGRTLRGMAEGVIHVAATTRTLWHGGSDSAAEGLDGSWEAYVILACRRIKPLKGAAQ